MYLIYIGPQGQLFVKNHTHHHRDFKTIQKLHWGLYQETFQCSWCNKFVLTESFPTPVHLDWITHTHTHTHTHIYIYVCMLGLKEYSFHLPHVGDSLNGDLGEYVWSDRPSIYCYTLNTGKDVELYQLVFFSVTALDFSLRIYMHPPTIWLLY